MNGYRLDGDTRQLRVARGRRLVLRRIARSVLAVAMASGGGLTSARTRSSAPPDAVWDERVHLRDPDGRERSLAEFHGMAVMLTFGFTQCPSVCPTVLARAVEVRQLLGERGRRLQVIFLTIDPERDTPAVLRAYTQAFDPSFLGLWGEPPALAEAARSLRIVYRKVPTPSGYTMDHTALSYVFDPAGLLRLVIDHARTAASIAAELQPLFDAVVS